MPIDPRTIVVLDGDQTGQELLEEALRVLASDVIGVELAFPRYDLPLERRRATANGVVHEAVAAIRRHGLGLKAATITPEAPGDVGSPSRILREEIGARVIVRTGRRLPGIVPMAGVEAPSSVVRMAVGDAYGRGSGASRVRVPGKTPQRLARARHEEPKSGQHEIGEDVAAAVERRDDERLVGRADEERERRVDELRLVLDRRVARRRGVHPNERYGDAPSGSLLRAWAFANPQPRRKPG
jgi:isocitrate dehydrogenase